MRTIMLWSGSLIAWCLTYTLAYLLTYKTVILTWIMGNSALTAIMGIFCLPAAMFLTLVALFFAITLFRAGRMECST